MRSDPIDSSTGKIDRATVENDWKARGFSCGLWVDPPGQVWEDYVHATDELVMLIEGALELEMQGRILRPAIGEEVLIAANTSYTVRNTGGTTARWLYGYRSLETKVHGDARSLTPHYHRPGDPA